MQYCLFYREFLDMGKITRRQRKTLAVLYTCNICVLSSVALMPPFFPEPDKNKGISATKTGLLFGIFRLTMALASPIYGKYMIKVGPKFLLTAGVYTAAGTNILMGVLENIPSHEFFYVVSFVLQVFAALGTASVPNVIACLIAVEFPENLASVFASTEAALSLSMMVVPFLTDIMEDVMGFNVPFIVSGCILILVAFMVNEILPDTIEDLPIRNRFRISEILCKKSVLIFTICLIVNGVSNGFFLGSLKYYLKPLHLSQFEITLMFILNSAVYSCCATCWGWLCDKKVSPFFVASIGASFIALSFLLSGFFTYLPNTPILSIYVISNIMFGVGNGALVVSTFTGLHREATTRNTNQDIRSGSLVGAIWNCCFCFGCFVGFTIGGVLLDNIGYKFTAFIIASLQILVLCTILLYSIWIQCLGKGNTINGEHLISPIDDNSCGTFYSCQSVEQMR
ncbi:unnamed protein product, partial [Meganyctiphanes norvegica]